jgi:hypothetical protein
VLFDRGKRTKVEPRRAPNEANVLAIAGAWSINPMTLGDVEHGGDGHGYLGEIRSAR